MIITYAVRMTTTILVVEDDERIRTAVRLALQKEGWKVLDAATGEEALQIFQSEKCDILLIDIMLPGMTDLKFAVLSGKLVRYQ